MWHFGFFYYRRWKSRATTFRTNCSSPEWARATKGCTSAGWREPTTERLWSTKPKLGWRSMQQLDPEDHNNPPRRAPPCTWQTRSRESPAHLRARTTWVQTRGWPPHPPLTHPPKQLHTTTAQVRPGVSLWQSSVEKSQNRHKNVSFCLPYNFFF